MMNMIIPARAIRMVLYHHLRYGLRRLLGGPDDWTFRETTWNAGIVFPFNLHTAKGMLRGRGQKPLPASPGRPQGCAPTIYELSSSYYVRRMYCAGAFISCSCFSLIVWWRLLWSKGIMFVIGCRYWWALFSQLFYNEAGGLSRVELTSKIWL